MNQRILLVDDDEETRSLVCDGLRDRGLDVEMVGSAHACLARIEDTTFDVVVTDVEMPGMSGIELCDALRRHTPPLVAIVVTGLRDLTTMTAAYANGAFEYLTKPIKLATLEAAIRRACAPMLVPVRTSRPAR